MERPGIRIFGKMKRGPQRPARSSVPQRRPDTEGRCTGGQGAFTFRGHRLGSLYRLVIVAR